MGDPAPVLLVATLPSPSIPPCPHRCPDDSLPPAIQGAETCRRFNRSQGGDEDFCILQQGLGMISEMKCEATQYLVSTAD